MMRLLANENVPGAAVRALRVRDHDVLWVREEAPGSDDPTVLARAVAERRVLLTLDKDFGELAFGARLPAECGVVLCRIQPEGPDALARAIVAALESRSDWPGHFAVVEMDRVRIRPLPSN